MTLPRLCDAFRDCPLEVIEWVDSQRTYSSWTYVEDIPDEKPVPGLMLTAGWVLGENKAAVMVAASLGGIDGRTTPQVCDVMTIPKVAIMRRHKLGGTRG